MTEACVDEIDYFADIDVPASVIVHKKKIGHPAARKAAAALVRRSRARFHQLHGGWSRSEWNYQSKLAGRNLIRHFTPSTPTVNQESEQ